MDKTTLLTQLLYQLSKIKLYYLEKLVASEAEVRKVQDKLAHSNGEGQVELFAKLAKLETVAQMNYDLYQPAIIEYELAVAEYNEQIVPTSKLEPAHY